MKQLATLTMICAVSLGAACLGAPEDGSHGPSDRDKSLLTFEDKAAAIAWLKDPAWDEMPSLWHASLTWPKIRDQAIARIDNPYRVDIRGSLKLCGPTAYISVLVQRFPEFYAQQLTNALFYGEWDGTLLAPKLLENQPVAVLLEENLEADYVALSSFRHVTPGLNGKRYCGTPGRQIAAMTWVHDMKNWLNAPPFSYTTKYKVFGGLVDVLRTNYVTEARYATEIDNAWVEEVDPLVLFLVDSEIITQPQNNDIADFGDHWIRMLQKPEVVRTPEGAPLHVYMNYYEHGQITAKIVPWENYKMGVFAYIIAKRPQ